MIDKFKQSINEVRDRAKRHKELNEKFNSLSLEEKEKCLKIKK